MCIRLIPEMPVLSSEGLANGSLPDSKNTQRRRMWEMWENYLDIYYFIIHCNPYYIHYIRAFIV